MKERLTKNKISKKEKYNRTGFLKIRKLIVSMDHLNGLTYFYELAGVYFNAKFNDKNVDI
jgi:hypothetical protein